MQIAHGEKRLVILTRRFAIKMPHPHHLADAYVFFWKLVRKGNLRPIPEQLRLFLEQFWEGVRENRREAKTWKACRKKFLPQTFLSVGLVNIQARHTGKVPEKGSLDARFAALPLDALIEKHRLRIAGNHAFDPQNFLEQPNGQIYMVDHGGAPAFVQKWQNDLELIFYPPQTPW